MYSAAPNRNNNPPTPTALAVGCIHIYTLRLDFGGLKQMPSVEKKEKKRPALGQTIIIIHDREFIRLYVCRCDGRRRSGVAIVGPTVSAGGRGRVERGVRAQTWRRRLVCFQSVRGNYRCETSESDNLSFFPP